MKNSKPDWGARRARVDAREAAMAAAIYGYRQAVLDGIEETENALNALGTHRRRKVEGAIRLLAARRADDHVDQLYRWGGVAF